MKRMLVIAVVVSALAAGCGGVENEPNLAQAAERTEALGTGRFEVEGVLEEDGKRVPLSCTGSADYERQRVHVRCEYGELGVLEAIAIERDSYFRGDFFLGPGAGDKWEKDTIEVDDETSLGTLSPQKLLALLRKASSDTERIGEGEVRGDATVRYRLTVDCEAAVLECEGTAPVDVWIAEDGIVRRIAIDDDEGEATFEFFDFGAQIDIEPPPADQLLAAGEGGTGSVIVSSGSGSSKEYVCADGDATPITQERAVEALRSHGFTVDDPENGCLLNNWRDDHEAEGLVDCGVHAEPPKGAPHTVTRRPSDFGELELALENFDCTIDTGETGREKKIARLEAVFEELERSIRP